MRTDAADTSAAGSATNQSARSAGPVPKDRAGVFFSARAVAPEGGGLWRLETVPSRTAGSDALPRSFRAELPAGSAPGTLFRFKAVRGEDGALRFDLLRRSAGPAAAGPAAVASAAAVSPGPAARADAASAALLSIVRAFGLTLQPGAFDRLTRSVLRVGGDPRPAALIAAVAADKGLELSDRALSETAAAIDPRRGSGDGERRGGGSRGDASSGGSGEGQSGRGRGSRRESSAAEAASVDLDPPDILLGSGPLALMNRVAGADGARWLFFPLRSSGPSIEIRATLGVLFKAGEILRLALDMASPSRYWSFDMPSGFMSGSRAALACDPPLGPEAGTVEAALNAALADLGVTVAVSTDAAEPLFGFRGGERIQPVEFEA